MIEYILQEIEKTGYSFVENLLNPEELRSVSHFFERHLPEFSAARIGPRDQNQRLASVRGDYTYWIDPLAPPRELSPLINFLDTLRDRLNEKFYFGLKHYECHLAFYPKGTFYSKHKDRFENNSSRRLSFVFYLNQQWNKEDGGELVLYDNQGSLLKSFHPTPGSFVTFLSDEFPHEVRISRQERRSFTGWMHTTIIY